MTMLGYSSIINRLLKIGGNVNHFSLGAIVVVAGTGTGAGADDAETLVVAGGGIERRLSA